MSRFNPKQKTDLSSKEQNAKNKVDELIKWLEENPYNGEVQVNSAMKVLDTGKMIRTHKAIIERAPIFSPAWRGYARNLFELKEAIQRELEYEKSSKR